MIPPQIAKTKWPSLAGCGLVVLTLLLTFAPPMVAEFEDHFDGAELAPGWSIRDGYALQHPSDTLNHATFSVNGSRLTVSFPGGAEHNMWWLKHAQVLRAYQGRGTYEIKVDSPLDGAQQFGLSFEHDSQNFMIFMLYAYPNDTIRAYIERFTFVDGQQIKSTFAGGSIGVSMPDAGPYHLRVSVDDNPDPTQRVWKCEWSRDGSRWTEIFAGVYEGASEAENIGAISEVGLFAGNQPQTFDGFTAEFDYFRFNEIGPVSGLSARGGDQVVDLWWGEVTGADQYAVYSADSGDGPFDLVGSTSNTSFSHGGLINGEQYFYVVVPFAGIVEGPASAVVGAVPHQIGGIGDLPEDGLILALRAEELAFLHGNGEAVTHWTSFSGAPMSATAPAMQAPTFRADGINGLPSVWFDGVDDHLTLPAGFEDFTGGLSVFVVMRPTVLQQGFKILALGNGAGQENIGLGRAGSTSGLQYFTNDISGGWGWFDTSGGLVAGEASLLSVVQQGGTANDLSQAELALHGSTLHAGNVYVPPMVTRGVNYIGRSYWNEGMFEGEIAEILIYNRALSPSEQVAVRDVVQARYGLGGAAAVPETPATPVAESGDGVVLLDWDEVAGASGYRVYRSESSGGNYQQIAEVSLAEYADITVFNGVTYYYSVTAYNAAGESGYAGEVAVTPDALPDPALPTAGLVLALDAQLLAQALGDGASVSRWADGSGHGNDAAAGTGAPVLAADAIGGKAAVRFDGVDDHLTLPAGFEDFTEGLSVFVVMRPTVLQHGFKIVALGNGAGQQNVVLGRAGSTSGMQYFTDSGSGGVGWFNSSEGLVAGEAVLISVVQQAGGGGDVVQAVLSANGASAQAGSVFVPPVATRGLNYIGKSYWNEGMFQGDMAEVLVYNRALESAEQAAVREYIQGKYGIGAPATPPEAPATPVAGPGDGVVFLDWNEVAGASGYRVYRSESSGGNYQMIAEVGATGFADATATNSVTYYYVVTAYNGAGESGHAGEAMATPTAVPVPVLDPAVPTAGLVLALDAEWLATALGDGASVETWADGSGLDNHAAAGVGAPVLAADAIGGRAAVRFDGVDDHLTLPAGFEDFTGGLSVFVVMRPAVLQQGFKIVALGNGAGQENVVLGRAGSTSGLQYFTDNGSGGVGWFDTSGGLVAGGTALISVVQEPGEVGSAVQAEISVNGASLHVGEVFGPPVATRAVNYIGRSYWNEGMFQGDIAEVLVYNRTLDASEKEAIEGYISQKYSFALP